MNTENWRDITGFPGYQISDRGRLRSFMPSTRLPTPSADGRILAGGKDKDGYRRAVLCSSAGRKSCRIADLVAAAFIGPKPPGMVLCHSNGDRVDNRVANLRYDTQRANLLDKHLHGTWQAGEKHPLAKLTEADVLAIRASTETYKALALRYNVTEGTISAVRTGRLWKHLPLMPVEGGARHTALSPPAFPGSS